MTGEEILGNLLVQYGLAGIVIYIFYRLISNELRELKDTIKELNSTITQLVIELKKTKTIQ